MPRDRRMPEMTSGMTPWHQVIEQGGTEPDDQKWQISQAQLTMRTYIKVVRKVIFMSIFNLLFLVPILLASHNQICTYE